MDEATRTPGQSTCHLQLTTPGTIAVLVCCVRRQEERCLASCPVSVCCVSTPQSSPTVRQRIYIYTSGRADSHFPFLLVPLILTFAYTSSPPQLLDVSKMLYSTLISAAALVAGASALQITAPTNSSGWTSTGSQMIEWDVSLLHLNPGLLPCPLLPQRFGCFRRHDLASFLKSKR